jgi:hypothetical protein
VNCVVPGPNLSRPTQIAGPPGPLGYATAGIETTGTETRKASRRRVGTLVGALALAASALVAGPGLSGTAQAATPVLSDGFEFPSTAWSFTASGPGFGFVDNVAAEAHTGSKSALLGMFGTGFASVGRNVNLPSTATTCTASAWIAPRLPATKKINFEVIDPSNFQYIALKQIQTSGAGSYQFHTVSWTKNRNNVLLRFSLIGEAGQTNRARVDDVAVTCN